MKREQRIFAISVMRNMLPLINAKKKLYVLLIKEVIDEKEMEP